MKIVKYNHILIGRPTFMYNLDPDETIGFETY